MDIKTLEYMKERVDEGLKIQEEIKSLIHHKGCLQRYETGYTGFNFRSGNGRIEVRGSINDSLVEAYLIIIGERIEKLEEEFAKL